MGKYYVTISNRKMNYKVCRDDICKVFSAKIKKTPSVPHYSHLKATEDDVLTLDQDS